MKFDDYVSNELYRDFAVLGVLIKHIQDEEHLVYENIMNQLGIGSKSTMRNCLFFLRDMLNVPIRSCGGKYGGVWIEKEWIIKGAKLSQDEVKLLIRHLNKCDNEDDYKILIGIILRNLDVERDFE